MPPISISDTTIQNHIDAFRTSLCSQIECQLAYNILQPQLGPSDDTYNIKSYISPIQPPLDTAARSHFYKIVATQYYSQHFPHFDPISIPVQAIGLASGGLECASPLRIGAPFDFANNVLVLPVFGPLNHTAIYIIDATASHKDMPELESHLILSRIFMAAQNFHILAVSDIIAQAQNRTAPLTNREKEILTWVSRGKSNSVIAEILGLSMHTVTGYVRNIYLKTQTNDRTSAAIYALSNGLLHTHIECPDAISLAS